MTAVTAMGLMAQACSSRPQRAFGAVPCVEMVESHPLYYYRRQPGRACRDFRSDALDLVAIDRGWLGHGE
jgi:hypothetical protein